MNWARPCDLCLEEVSSWLGGGRRTSLWFLFSLLSGGSKFFKWEESLVSSYNTNCTGTKRKAIQKETPRKRGSPTPRTFISAQFNLSCVLNYSLQTSKEKSLELPLENRACGQHFSILRFPRASLGAHFPSQVEALEIPSCLEPTSPLVLSTLCDLL